MEGLFDFLHTAGNFERISCPPLCSRTNMEGFICSLLAAEGSSENFIRNTSDTFRPIGLLSTKGPKYKISNTVKIFVSRK